VVLPKKGSMMIESQRTGLGVQLGADLQVGCSACRKANVITRSITLGNSARPVCDWYLPVSGCDRSAARPIDQILVAFTVFYLRRP